MGCTNMVWLTLWQLAIQPTTLVVRAVYPYHISCCRTILPHLVIHESESVRDAPLYKLLCREAKTTRADRDASHLWRPLCGMLSLIGGYRRVATAVT